MKLFRKVFLYVSFGLFVLSAGILLVLLWEVQQKSLSAACQYETEEIHLLADAIRENLRDEGVAAASDAVKRAVLVNQFRMAFGRRAILWEEGREVYNATPYVLDKDRLDLLRKNAQVPIGEDYVLKPQAAAGKKLLVFYRQEAGIGVPGYGFAVFQDVSGIYLQTKQLFFKGMGIACVMLVLVGAALYVGIYRAFLPLCALKQAAGQMAGGMYEARVPVTGRDEIADVTRSFNQMAEKVQKHLAALEETGNRQRQLLGSLAHELKTPLTAVIGNAQLLLAVPLAAENRTKALSHILAEGKRLARLSEKMLDLVGLYENEGCGIRKREMEILPLLDRLKNQTAFLLLEKAVCLQISCEPGNLKMEMDDDLMLSLLANLVENAYKASPQGACILLSAKESGIFVQDFGTGIPKDEVCRVTEAFYKVDKSRSEGSSGLGLALCQQIARLHGGILQIESTEGKGTMVSVLWQC